MVTIYTTNNCKQGRKVIKFLKENEVEFDLKNINENPDYKEELVNLGYNDNLPVTVVEGKEIIGYKPIELNDLMS